MPRIPTIFDDTLIETFSQLFKTAQDVDPFTAGKENDPFDATNTDLINKLLDGLLSEASNGPAPTIENFTTPESLIGYMQTYNIVSPKDGNPIVYNQQVEGYAPYTDGQYINVDGLKALLNQYKDAAKQQGSLKGQYFMQAINNLIGSLQSKQGFQDIGKPEQKAVTPAQKTPETPVSTTKPETPQQNAAGSAAVAQFNQKVQSMGGSGNMIFPLPSQGKGMFDVDRIYAGMNAFYQAIVGTPIARELGSKLGSMRDYINQVQQYTATFKSITNNQAEFMVSGNDTQQTYRFLDLMFNPNRASGGMTNADGSHFGPVAAMRAVQSCEFIVNNVAAFFADLNGTSIDAEFSEQIMAQIQSAEMLSALFKNVADQFATYDRSARTPPNQRIGYSG